MGGRITDCEDGTARSRQLLPKGAYWALTVLTSLNIINVWHRYLIYNLAAVSVEDCEDVCEDVSFVPLCYIDDITSSASEEACLSCRNSYNTEFYNLKDGACIDNSQYGILADIGFTLTFAFATLFAGRLVDTVDRRLLHTGAILVWSLAAAAHGMCTDFSCLLVARTFLGVGEAFNAPACYALITLYFPHSKRATANGIYSTGTYLGSAVSSLCLAIAVALGWRNTAFLSGAFGVLAGAVLFLTVEHDPAMPPSEAGYTRLPDDEDLHDNPHSCAPTGGSYHLASRRKMMLEAGAITGREQSATRIVKGAVPLPPPPPGGALAFGGDSGGGPVVAHGVNKPGASGSVLLSSGYKEEEEEMDDGAGGGSARPPVKGRGDRKWSRSGGAASTDDDGTGNPFAPNSEDGDGGSRVAKGGRGGDGGGGSPDWGWYDDQPTTAGAGETGDREDDDWEDNTECEVSGCGLVASMRTASGPDGGGDGGADGASKHDLGQALRMITSNRVVLMLFVASSARMVGTWSMAGYCAIYYHRAFPSQVELFSILNAVSVSIGGVASSYGGGAIADRLRVRDEGVLGYLPAVGSLAALPATAVALFSPSFGVSVFGLFVSYLIGECWLGPGMALLQMELPKELAGTSVAILLFLNSVLCNIGPSFVAWQDSGLATVNRPLFAAISVSYVISFFLFLAVGFMVSQKHKRRRGVLASMEPAGVLEDVSGFGPRPGSLVKAGEKSVNIYNRRSSDSLVDASSGVVGGRAPAASIRPRTTSSGASMCELVRRTFTGIEAGVPGAFDDAETADIITGRNVSRRGGLSMAAGQGGLREAAAHGLRYSGRGDGSHSAVARASASRGYGSEGPAERQSLLAADDWSNSMASGRRA